MSGFTFTRGHATIDPDIRTPYVHELDDRLPARALAQRGDRGPLRRQPRQQPLAQLQHQRDEHHRERLPATSSGTRSGTSQINVANGRTGFANNGLPGQVGAADLRGRVRSARLAAGGARPAAASRNGTFVTQLQQGQAGRLANTLAGDFRYLCAMVGNALPGCASRGYNAARPVPDQRLPGEPVRAPARTCGILTDEAIVEVRLAAAAVPAALQPRPQPDGELHLRQGAHRPLRRRRRQRRSTTSRCATRGSNWGPTAYDLRHTFQTYWTYDLPFGDGRRFDIDNGLLESGRSAAGRPPAIVRVQTRPAVPAPRADGRRSTSTTPAWSSTASRSTTCRRWSTSAPVRTATCSSSTRRSSAPTAAPTGSLLTHRRRPVSRVSTSISTARDCWTADLGLAKTFTPAGRLAHQLRGAVHQRLQPPQRRRRRHRRRDAEHRFDDVRPDHDCRRRRAARCSSESALRSNAVASRSSVVRWLRWGSGFGRTVQSPSDGRASTGRPD